MSQPVLLKVYGSLFPATPDQYVSAQSLCDSGLPQPAAVDFVEDLLTVSFEGIWLPWPELGQIWLQALPDQKGKLDILDLEAWQLTRHALQAGRCRVYRAPLNNVLNYSGH